LLEDKYRVLIEKTGYDAEQGKVVPRTKWDPKKKKGPQKRVLNLDWNKNKSETLDEEERKPIQLTKEAFQELFDQIRELKKTELTNE